MNILWQYDTAVEVCLLLPLPVRWHVSQFICPSVNRISKKLWMIFWGREGGLWDKQQSGRFWGDWIHIQKIFSFLACL